MSEWSRSDKYIEELTAQLAEARAAHKELLRQFDVVFVERNEARAELAKSQELLGRELQSSRLAVESENAIRAKLGKAIETLQHCYEQADGGLQAEHDCPAVFACSSILVDTMEALGILLPAAAQGSAERCKHGVWAADHCWSCADERSAGAEPKRFICDACGIIYEGAYVTGVTCGAPFGQLTAQRAFCGGVLRPVEQQSTSLPEGGK